MLTLHVRRYMWSGRRITGFGGSAHGRLPLEVSVSVTVPRERLIQPCSLTGLATEQQLAHSASLMKALGPDADRLILAPNTGSFQPSAKLVGDDPSA